MCLYSYDRPPVKPPHDNGAPVPVVKIYAAVTAPRSMRKARVSRSETWLSFDSEIRIVTPCCLRLDELRRVRTTNH